MDPALQEDSKRDKERTALSRSLNSLALAVQSSVFGGLGSLAHDLTLTEKGSLDTARNVSRVSAPEAPPLHLQAQQQPQPAISATFFDHQTEHQQQRPWYKKKYRIIVQEISDKEDDNSYSDPNISDTTTTGRPNTLAPESDTAIVSTLPKSGSSSSSSSPAMPPGLLDWLLFTTHEDSFFRHLGRAHALVRQDDHRIPDVAAANDTNALSHIDAHPNVTPVVTLSQAIPESASPNSQSNIAMALATEINHSATSVSETPNETSVQIQTFEPTPVLMHRQQETMTAGTTSVRSNGFEGEHVQDAGVPRKVDFENMDLQTPWWKKRQHREQERQPWLSNQNHMPVQEEAKDKTELRRVEETLDRPNFRRRLQGETAEQPKALETFVKTTVSTRPDGAIESKTVKVSTLLKEPQELPTLQDQDRSNNRHGWFNRHHHDDDYRGHMGPQTMVETETCVKVVHPDGSVEETVSFTRADNPSPECVNPSARTRREHRHFLRQQERERREQVWQAQQERQQRQLEHQGQGQEQQRAQLQEQLRQQAHLRQQEHLRQQQEQQRSSEPNVKNEKQSQATRCRIRERWARHRQENQDSDQDEPSLSRTRSRSWPPKGYLRRQSQSEQAEPHLDDQRHDTESSRSTWPPKAYLRRQEREQ
ncbi:hypothetical protein BG005_009641 [Podila minutissima]|nr:hypothetical protein BG005_009641 [Podila minutissima]